MGVSMAQLLKYHRGSKADAMNLQAPHRCYRSALRVAAAQIRDTHTQTATLLTLDGL